MFGVHQQFEYRQVCYQQQLEYQHRSSFDLVPGLKYRSGFNLQLGFDPENCFPLEFGSLRKPDLCFDHRQFEFDHWVGYQLMSNHRFDYQSSFDLEFLLVDFDRLINHLCYPVIAGSDQQSMAKDLLMIDFDPIIGQQMESSHLGVWFENQQIDSKHRFSFDLGKCPRINFGQQLSFNPMEWYYPQVGQVPRFDFDQQSVSDHWIDYIGFNPRIESNFGPMFHSTLLIGFDPMIGFDPVRWSSTHSIESDPNFDHQFKSDRRLKRLVGLVLQFDFDQQSDRFI